MCEHGIKCTRLTRHMPRIHRHIGIGRITAHAFVNNFRLSFEVGIQAAQDLVGKTTFRPDVVREFQTRIDSQIAAIMRGFRLSIFFIGDILDFIHRKVNGLGPRDDSKPKGTYTWHLQNKGLETRRSSMRQNSRKCSYIEAFPFDPIAIGTPETHCVCIFQIPVDRSSSHLATTFD